MEPATATATKQKAKPKSWARMGREANAVDKHVGARVRMARLMVGMSQEKLGDALGLTFQQVQKYEKGMNRISASRMVQISNAVGVPVTFFFESSGVTIKASRDADEFLTTREGLALARAFMEIKNLGVKQTIVELVERLSRKEHRSG